MTTTQHTASTPTEAVKIVAAKAAAGEHGTLEFPCHVAPGSTATVDEVCAMFERCLDLLGIEAAVEFTGTLVTVVI